MSDFILLKEKTRCPVCSVRRSFVSGNCHNCGLRLFTSDCDTDFDKFEEGTAVANWWAYNREFGWRHRDYYMVAGAKPQVKRFEIETLSKDYGMKETPESVRNKKAQTTRVLKKEKMKYKGKIV